MSTVRLIAIPDLFKLHASDPANYPVLLETAAGEGWHILMAYPTHWQRYDANQGENFFDQFHHAWHQEHTARAEDAAHLPFRGGWFVYLGYELAHTLEPSVPTRTTTSVDFPTATLMRIPAAVMVNNVTHEAWLFAESDALMMRMQQDIAQQHATALSDVILETLIEEPEEIFLEGVNTLHRYIAAGDVFQVNLSRRWRGQLGSPNCAAALYQALRNRNPAPFAGIANLGEEKYIISSSPERLVQVKGGWISTRPIAGTHPRHPQAQRDAQIRDQLIAHPKERAEHIMLVDLERNDLGRVCIAGSVLVDELMAVTSYQHVHHIESTVSGHLKTGITPPDVVRALFPGGTITGCPKVRTMQIIREMESSPRGAYTGSMGYINLDGDFDLNILIRSFMLSGQQFEFSAGAGIVADSDAERELNETRAKAKGMLRALGIMT